MPAQILAVCEQPPFVACAGYTLRKKQQATAGPGAKARLAVPVRTCESNGLDYLQILAGPHRSAFRAAGPGGLARQDYCFALTGWGCPTRLLLATAACALSFPVGRQQLVHRFAFELAQDQFLDTLLRCCRSEA